MNSKIKIWRIGVTTLSIIFLSALLWNTAMVFYFHPPVHDGVFWALDKNTKQVYIKTYVDAKSQRTVSLVPGDTLLAINENPVVSINESWQYVKSFGPDTVLHYKIKRGEQVLTVPVTLKRMTSITTLAVVSALVGFLFLLVGFVVLFKKPFLRTSRLFFLFSVSFFLSIGLNVLTEQEPFSRLLMVMNSIGIALWGPSVLYFFMNFPIRAGILNKYPNFGIWLFLPSFLVWASVFFFHQPKLLITIVLTIYFSFAFATFIRSKRKIRNPHEQKSLKLILLAMWLGLVPIGALAFFSNYIIQNLGFTTVSIVFSATSLVPIAFGYSIMRYGLMDVEIIIKKSLIYTFMTTSIVLIYFLLVVGLGGFIIRRYGISSEAANLVFLLLVALLFQPVRTQIQKFIDRRFFRERYQYQQTLLQLSQKLPGMVQVQEVLRHIAETISAAMHVTTVNIYLYDLERKEYAHKFSTGTDAAQRFNWKDEPNSLVNILKREKSCCLFYKIDEDSRYHNLPVSDKLKLEKMNISLAVPMFYKDRLLGLFTLGPKQSGQVYNQEDMDLLLTVAGNASIALVNARLHQEDVKKQRLENELLLARQIQTKLLPAQVPELPGMELASASLPATIVGGDYYDYISVSPNRLFIIIGDVSGKGMPAALYMSKVQGMLQAMAPKYKSPGKLFMDLNQLLNHRIQSTFFVTMIGLLLNTSRKKVTLCRAGHTFPYLVQEGKAEKLETSGIGLGLDSGQVFDAQLKETTFVLPPGAFLVIYSDGLTERMNTRLEMYGEKRLEDVLQAKKYQSAKELQEAILEDVRSFAGEKPAHDDITLIVLHRKGR